MDIGQVKAPSGKEASPPAEVFKPFARPRRKRRRTVPSKPAVIAVRPNPAHYILDFADTSKKVEKLVCRTIVSDKRAVSVVGLPGSGKTVILRGVAYNPAVMDAFRDGIFFVQLAHTATVKSLFDYLVEILEKCDMRAIAHHVRQTQRAADGDGDSEAANLFVQAIKDKNLLLIFDNVTEHPPAVYNVLVAINNNIPRPQRSFSILSSTRSVEVAKVFGSSAVLEVSLPEPAGDVARAIMCCHAGFDRIDFDVSCSKEGNSIIPVLRKCAGLPLALAVAGGAVKRLLSNGKTALEKEQIWGHYRSYLCGSFDQFGQISGLYAALSTCVERVPRERDWRTALGVSEVLSALSIVSSGAWLPYQILQRLWGLKKKEDVLTVVRPLSKLCLVSRARRGMSVGIIVPEIVLEYCRHEAKQNGVEKQWHLKLLKSYVDQGSKFAAIVQVTEDEGGVKWERSNDEDEYLRTFLQHHVDAVDSLEPSAEEKLLATEGARVVKEKFLQPMQAA